MSFNEHLRNIIWFRENTACLTGHHWIKPIIDVMSSHAKSFSEMHFAALL